MKDYLTNKTHAEELAQTIRNWWFVRTGKTPKVWLEKQDVLINGEKVKSHWNIRSDIKMKVPHTITRENSVGQTTNVVNLLKRK